MQGLGLVNHGLQCHRIGYEFIVDDGFLLVGRIVGSKQSISAKGQVFREFVVSLDLRRTLMHGAPHGVVHDPFQQVRGADGSPQFLQGEREPIAGAVAVDACEHRRRCKGATLDGQSELHKLRVVFPDQRPVDRATEHRVDVLVFRVTFRAT